MLWEHRNPPGRAWGPGSATERGVCARVGAGGEAALEATVPVRRKITTASSEAAGEDRRDETVGRAILATELAGSSH